MGRPGFPQLRPRRLRLTAALRDAVADVRLGVDQLICPLFVSDAPTPRAVASMPGVHQWPVADAVATIRQLRRRGLRQFILFGVTPDSRKDPQGRYASDPDCPVNRTLAAVRDAGLDVVMIADLCLCEYTDHGHCGIVQPDPRHPAGMVSNDHTLVRYGEIAVAQARAGADLVAPSGMMDGQVGAIRSALDEAGFIHTAILAYSVKYASNLYGPFRDAGQGHVKDGGDRRGYQMDFRRRDEWRDEILADLAEGADLVMVKPAATYLDIVRAVRDEFPGVPLAAYHVSGEYAMLHAAAERGWVDLRAAALETTLAIRRAGANLIVTYFAPDLATWLVEA